MDQDTFDKALAALDTPDGEDAETPATPDPEPESDEQADETELEGDEPDDGDEPDPDALDEAADATPETGAKVEVTDDTVLVLPDGSEVTVKDGALRQADYTRKTQALADERRELEAREEAVANHEQEVVDWLEAKTADPASFILEIAEQTGNLSYGLAVAIKQAADAGKLDPRMQELFQPGAAGSPTKQIADEGQTASRLDQIEATQKQQREEAARQAELREAQERLLGEWQEATSSVEFPTRAAEQDTLIKVAEYAQTNGITDMRVAWKSYAFDHPEAARQGKKPPPKPNTSAITRKPASRGGTPKPKPKPTSIDGASMSAWEKAGLPAL